MIGFTSGKAYPLWRAGRDIAIPTDNNAYKDTIFTFIECSVMYTSSIVVLTLHEFGSRRT